MRGEAEDVLAVLDQIAALSPDIAVLRGIDYDHDLAALRLMQQELAARGHPMAYRFALRPNAGEPTRFDLDRDGRFGRARDKQGFGFFRGNGGMAILSRHPILGDQVRDMSDLLWVDLPNAIFPVVDDGPYYTQAEIAILRLHTVGAWEVPIQLPKGQLRILTSHAGPPVFDGPEDRNGLRNAAEIAFWEQYIAGALGDPPARPFMLAAGLNADPNDGEGAHDTIRDLLSLEQIRDPLPSSEGARQAADTGHLSGPQYDTVDWPSDRNYPGNLRIDYILPDASLSVVAAGVDWPVEPPASGFGSAHRPVWIDIEMQ